MRRSLIMICCFALMVAAGCDSAKSSKKTANVPKKSAPVVKPVEVAVVPTTATVPAVDEGKSLPAGVLAQHDALLGPRCRGHVTRQTQPGRGREDGEGDGLLRVGVDSQLVHRHNLRAGHFAAQH